MVQSLGISVGNANSYVAGCQGGGIEILLNEFSNRSTPSMVAFTDQSRTIGVEANSNFFMNLKNTVHDLMVLLGKPCEEIEADRYPFKIEKSADGEALVVVRHLGEERKFTITQVLAMLFTKLRGVAKDSLDCVLSCPQFYNDKQKASLLQAALIAGLNPLQIIDDMSAVLLNYAYYRTSKDDPPKYIAFLNFGQSNLQCTVAWLAPKDDLVRVIAVDSEPVGGRDFDKVLAEHFVKTSNLSLNQKSYLKLVSACEKLKRNLSANSNEIPLNVESLISEDKDYSARIERATFESLSSDLFKRVEDCLRRTLLRAKERSQENGTAGDTNGNAHAPQETTEPPAAAEPAAPTEPQEANKSEGADEPQDAAEPQSAPEQPETVQPPAVFEIQAVEMVGGSTRIPAIRRIVQEVFGMAPSTTLNTDEAVARGCVLHCATLHPGTKVKRYIKLTGVEPFGARVDCDKDLRRIELELIKHDRDHVSRTEARNNLEEYIYSERSSLPDDDPFKAKLSEALDWLFSCEGEDAPEKEYNAKLTELRSLKNLKLAAEQQEREAERLKKEAERQKKEGEPQEQMEVEQQEGVEDEEARQEQQTENKE